MAKFKPLVDQEKAWSALEQLFKIKRPKDAHILILKHAIAENVGSLNRINVLFAQDLCLFEVNLMSYHRLEWPKYWVPHPVMVDFLQMKHVSTGHIFFTLDEIRLALGECKHLIGDINWNTFTQWTWLEQQVRKPLEDMQIDDVRRVCGPFAELIMVLRDERLEPTWGGERDESK